MTTSHLSNPSFLSSAPCHGSKNSPNFYFGFRPGLTAFASESHSGVASAPETLFHLGPLPVTNSMVTSWVVAAVLIIAIRLAVRKPTLVPASIHSRPWSRVSLKAFLS